VGETGFPGALLPPAGQLGRGQRSSSTPSRHQPRLTCNRRRSEAGLRKMGGFHAWLVGLANGLLCLTDRRPQGRPPIRRATSEQGGQEDSLHRHSLERFSQDRGTEDSQAGRRPMRQNVSTSTSASSPRTALAALPAMAGPTDQFSKLVVDQHRGETALLPSTNYYGPVSSYAAPLMQPSVPTTAATGMSATKASSLTGGSGGAEQYSQMSSVVSRIPSWQRCVYQ
jgi:hypothetical protein